MEEKSEVSLYEDQTKQTCETRRPNQGENCNCLFLRILVNISCTSISEKVHTDIEVSIQWKQLLVKW